MEITRICRRDVSGVKHNTALLTISTACCALGKEGDVWRR
jgi:hypothetical protein